MTTENKYENLFNDNSKCLTPEQMKLYVQNVLSPIEKRNIENHLLECEFCSDAMDGLKQQNVVDYQKEVDLLNKQIKRRAKYNSRKHILYSPWKIIAVAASVLFLVLLSGIYFDWFLHTRFENVAKNIQDLSSKVSDLALLKKEEKKDTVTIIKEKAAENIYATTATATDDISPLNEQEKALTDSTLPKNEWAVDGNKEDVKTENVTATATNENLKNGFATSTDDEAKVITKKSKALSSASLAMPSANYNNVSNKAVNDAALENQADKKNITVKNVDETEGLKQYNTKNYTKAISSLSNVVAKETTNFQARYYLGMSYVQAAKYIEAIKQFDFIMLNNNQDWYDDARYQKALSHLKIDDETTARNLFEQIVSENGKYKTEAQQQLDGLQK